MEIREALRDRNRLVTKLTQQQPNLAIFIQKCSHFRIQINNYIFIDMADLAGLQFYENEEVVTTLTNDFGSMTNEILRQSNFYENHEFQINEEQETSAFNQFLRNTVTRQSKIMLLTFVSNEAEDEISSTIALDFSHKIRQYFSGQSDDCPIESIVRNNEVAIDPSLAAWSFAQLDQAFTQLQRLQRRVDVELARVSRTNHFSRPGQKAQASAPRKLSAALDKFKDWVSGLLSRELAEVLEADHLFHVRQMIEGEIEDVQHALGSLHTASSSTLRRVSSAKTFDGPNHLLNPKRLSRERSQGRTAAITGARRHAPGPPAQQRQGLATGSQQNSATRGDTARG